MKTLLKALETHVAEDQREVETVSQKEVSRSYRKKVFVEAEVAAHSHPKL
jgi:hypothetical protein